MKVLPKLDAAIKVRNETIDYRKDVSEFSIPWIVQNVKGERLRVGNHKKGWVQRSQVVTLDEALAYYTRLINNNQQKAWAYSLRGVAWREKGDFDLAVAYFGEKLRLDPTAMTYNNRGAAWSDKKDYDKAIADYNQAIRLNPNNATAYYNRAITWYEKKDYDKAIADYTQAIHLNPNYAKVFNNVAWLRATCPDERYRDGKTAVELATIGCELSGWTNAYGFGTLGAAYAEAGDFDSAIKYQDRAIELNPSDAEFVKRAKERLALYNYHKPYRED